MLTARAGILRWRHALAPMTPCSALVLPPGLAMLPSRRRGASSHAAAREDDTAAAGPAARAGADDTAADLLLTLARRDVANGAFRTAERLL